jgi:hypothetical protein
MVYCCEKCQKEFLKKSNYLTHINRKKSCIPEEHEQEKILKRTCQYCFDIYASPYAMKTHINICKKKPTELEELKQIIVQLNDKLNNALTEQNDKINNELKEIKEKVDKPNITNNNTFNVQNNIIVTPFGKEDLSFLTIKDYKKIFNKGCYSIPEIVRLIHCNDNKPEFMNIYIKNYKDEYIFTFDGKDWDIEKKDDIFNNMIENKRNLLESKFEDFQDELPKYAIDMFKKFLEKSDDNEVINSMKDELKNMFYKNRNHVIKNVMTTQERLKKIKYEPEIIIVQDGAKKPTKKAIKNVENEIVIVQDGAKKPTKKATNINKK